MLEITLDNEEIIEIVNINLRNNSVDWKRKTGYTGDCMSSCAISSWADMQTEIKTAVEAELEVD